MSGCAVQPQPVTEQEIRERVNEQHRYLVLRRPAAGSALSLSDAIVQALRHNLELERSRLQLMIADTELANTIYKQLPASNLTFNRSIRNNDGGEQFDPTPPDRDRHSGSAAVYWSALDLGQAYLEARQSSNDLLKAGEQQRRVATRIVREVISAYLTVATLEPVISQSKDLESGISASLAKAGQLATSQLIDPVQLLEYREQLLGLKIQLKDMEDSYLQAKQRLAVIVNAPSLNIELAPNSQWAPLPEIGNYPVEQLEQFALYARSELRESDYRIRNAQLEVRRTWLSALPNVQFGASYHYDSEPTLNNTEWVQVDLNIAMKLFELLALPHKIREMNQRVELEKLSSVVLAVSVLDQVREANLVVHGEKRRWQLYRQRSQLQHEISVIKSQRLRYGPMDELDAFRAQVDLVAAQLYQARAFSQYQSAVLQLLEQLGVDLYPSAAPIGSPEQLRSAVDVWLATLPGTVAELLARV
ncbi:TolC family protein [Photobacterium sanctipauli]|uniref:TolC family protein n=1 Tax=Photobacterium sanctipauli TaxID=1342794 RepID=UPI00136402CB|nr:TolC family protein [Photobacterium sanctipauli]